MSRTDVITVLLFSNSASNYSEKLSIIYIMHVMGRPVNSVIYLFNINEGLVLLKLANKLLILINTGPRLSIG